MATDGNFNEAAIRCTSDMQNNMSPDLLVVRKANALLEYGIDEIHFYINRLQLQKCGEPVAGNTLESFLKSIISRKSREAEKLRKDIETLQRYLAQLQKQDPCDKQSGGKHQQDLKRMQDVINPLIKENRDLKAAWEIEKKTYLDARGQLEKQVSELEKTLKKAESERLALDAKNRKLFISSEALKIELVSLKKLIDQLTKENDALNSRNQALSAEKDKLAGILRDIEERLAKSESIIKQLEDEKKKVESIIAANKENLLKEALSGQSAILELKEKALTEKLRVVTGQRNRLKEKMVLVEERLRKIRKRVIWLTYKIKALEMDNQGLRGQIGQLKNNLGPDNNVEDKYKIPTMLKWNSEPILRMAENFVETVIKEGLR